MPATDGFLADPSDTREEILRATYAALREYGYSDLSVQRIADEFPKSKSLIYHHYDGKDDLLLDFLEYVLERFEGEVPACDDGPDAHLQAVIDHVLATPLPAEREGFAKAMVELRAQATTDERYRDHFTEHDRVVRDRLADTIRRGTESGHFADVDPEAAATFLLATFTGAMTQRVTSDEDRTATVREACEAHVATVLADE